MAATKSKKTTLKKRKVGIDTSNEFSKSIIAIVKEHLPVILKYNPHLYQIILSAIDLSVLAMSENRYNRSIFSPEQSNQVSQQMQQPVIELNEETKKEVDDIINDILGTEE